MRKMLWLIAVSLVLAAFQFDEPLGALLVFSPAEVHFLSMGALFGLSVGLLIRKIETI
jgi:hypothetical protein